MMDTTNAADSAEYGVATRPHLAPQLLGLLGPAELTERVHQTACGVDQSRIEVQGAACAHDATR